MILSRVPSYSETQTKLPPYKVVESLRLLCDGLHLIGDDAEYEKFNRMLQSASRDSLQTDNRVFHLYLSNDEMRQINEATIQLYHNPMFAICSSFMGILGVDPALAREWYSRGFRTIAQVRASVDAGDEITLTELQMNGLLYYSDLNTPLYRRDVVAIADKIIAMIKKIVPRNSFIEIAGSYRRGLTSCEDVTIVVANRPAKEPTGVKASIIESGSRIPTFILTLYTKLEESSAPASGENGLVAIVKSDQEQLSFLYRHNGVARKVNVIYAEFRARHVSLIQHTGSHDHILRIHAAANAQGYTITSDGLYTILSDGSLRYKRIATEESLYKTIGLKYVLPCERIN